MKTKIILFGICLFRMMSIHAQNMVSIEAPMGVSVVYGIDYHSVWYAQIKAMTVFLPWDKVKKENGEYGRGWSLHYGATVEQRYYYNILKRQEKGKKTLNKSADYISITSSYKYQQANYDGKRSGNLYFYCSVNWGLRRSFGKRWYIDGSVGFGPDYYDKWHAFSTYMNVNAGYKLF